LIIGVKKVKHLGYLLRWHYTALWKRLLSSPKLSEENLHLYLLPSTVNMLERWHLKAISAQR